jgi:pSer/pThr/pTyr-binding forkhead associated (FHA) protein
MARLILSLDGQVLAEYTLNKERCTVGRLPDNDVRIDNPAVSGHHSLVINVLNDSFLEDLSSTNGTYVNGKLIKKHALQHGDVITVGHHQLRFVEDEDAGENDLFARTQVITPDGDAGRSATLRGPDLSGLHAVLRDPPPGVTALPRARLQVLSGAFAGREVELSKTLTTIGRPGSAVAAITWRKDGHYLVHVDSVDPGTYPQVNGSDIGPQPRRLVDNDVIQVAGVKMAYFLAN